MIEMPHRSITRFFVPMIDVLTLLFCIYLLMPIVQDPATGESDVARAERIRPARRCVSQHLSPRSTDWWPTVSRNLRAPASASAVARIRIWRTLESNIRTSLRRRT